MGKNALGETTVPVVANRRLSYHERLVVPGQRFECDERQARAWEKTGVATIVSERPSFNKPQPVAVDPVLAKVLHAENPTQHPESPSGDVEEPEPVIASAAGDAQGVATATTEVPPPPPAPPVVEAAPRGRYDRRDMRSRR